MDFWGFINTYYIYYGISLLFYSYLSTLFFSLNRNYILNIKYITVIFEHNNSFFIFY